MLSLTHSIAQLQSDKDPSQGLSVYALDPVAAARLWAVSEAMVKQQFPLSRL